MKPECTEAARRTISIHRREDLHIRLRKQAKIRRGRAELRRRFGVEHPLARIGAIQGPKARHKKTRKIELDLNRAAAVANLQRTALVSETA